VGSAQPSGPVYGPRVEGRAADERPEGAAAEAERAHVRLSLAIAFVAAASALACGSSDRARYAGSNLILLSVDTLRADHLSIYGYPRETAPHLSRVAAEGIVFERVFAARAHTWPSLTTLLTAQSPRSTNVRGPGEALPEGFPTALDALSDAGYPNAGFIAPTFCAPARRLLDETVCGEDGELVDAAMEWLRAHAASQPFFLWVHLLGPHTPYRPSSEYARFTRDDPSGTASGEVAALREIYVEKKQLSGPELAHIIGLYDGAVLEADAGLGRLYAEIERLGLTRDSVIVFSSDHGEDLYEHNRFFGHACSIYDSSLRVPLVIRLPDRRLAGTRIADVLGLIDLMPTLLELVGVPRLGSFEGESFVARIFEGRKPRFQSVISEHYRTRQAGEIFSIRTDRWRYVYNPSRATPFCVPPGNHYPVAEEELYDHRVDPSESTNLARLRPEVAAGLRSELLSRLSTTPAPAEPLHVDDPETLERLRELGYLPDE
jgi:arylsulfatase A-like enzyme